MPDPIPDQNDRQDTDDHNKFVTVSRLEINQILHALARQAVLVTAGVGGDKFFLTSVLEVDEDADQVLIESGKHNPLKARELAGQRILCTATLDKIKIRFQLDSVTLAVHDGQEAFLAPLPQQLMRLQRREYFRMPTPITTPVKCSLLALDQKTPAAAIELNLLDISCGGFAVMTAPEIFSPELGAQYECALKLPESEPLKTKVQARNVSTIVLPNSKTRQRLAFVFVDLPQRSLAIIQRYLMHLQRERKARGTR